MPNLYVSQVLQADETVKYEQKKADWPRYVILAAIFIFVAWLFYIGYTGSTNFYSEISSILSEEIGYDCRIEMLIIASCLFAILILLLLNAGGVEITVTDARLIIKRGVFSRTIDELYLIHIGKVRLRQSIWERLLGSGSMTLHTTGGTRFKIPRVSKVIILRQHIPVTEFNPFLD